jgi:hypothetical protein
MWATSVIYERCPGKKITQKGPKIAQSGHRGYQQQFKFKSF